ncbi:hypothetical protein V8J88_24440 [Massilia sp. W12]|uniref:hypothetical protein n=1 Tax=Massilia sp. W12 TaxID=3126507 RepID=UPI0030CD8552
MTHPNIILGSWDNDILKDTDGADIMYGNRGNDHIASNSGNDTLHGGDGYDFLSITAPAQTHIHVVYQQGEQNDMVKFETPLHLDLPHVYLDLQGAVRADSLLFSADSVQARFDERSNDTYGVFVPAAGLFAFEHIRLPDGEILQGAHLAQLITSQNLSAPLKGSEGDDVLHSNYSQHYLAGGKGNDRLFGREERNLLDGGEGDDYLEAEGRYSSHLQGGAGNDVLKGRGAATVFNGGDGNDTFQPESERNFILFGHGSGEDRIPLDYGAYQNVQIQFGADINPSALRMQIKAMDPAQFPDYWQVLEISLIGSNDKISLEYWHERKYNTSLKFANGVIWREAEINAFIQSHQTSQAGGAADDILAAGLADGLLEGGDGHDQLSAAPQGTYLSGGNGNDTLTGSGGDDVFDAGAGNDLIISAQGGHDTLYFGTNSGTDRVSVLDPSQAAKLNVRLLQDSEGHSLQILRQADGSLMLTLQNSSASLTLPALASASEGRHTHLESITFADGRVWDAEKIWHEAARSTVGTAMDDYIQAGTNGYIDGGAGNDTIIGGATDLSMVGGAGDDVLISGAGNGTISMGPGNNVVRYSLKGGQDTIYEGDSASLNVLELGSGIYPENTDMKMPYHSLTLSWGADSSLSFPGFAKNIYAWFDEVRFADGTVWHADDFATALPHGDESSNLFSGSDFHDYFHGMAGDDTLLGMSSDDYLYGGDGNDSLSGGEHNDWLWGGSGNDSLNGGLGNDVLDGGAGVNAFYFNPGDGQDRIASAPSGAKDTLFIGGGVLKSQLTYSYDESSNSMQIQLPGVEDRISVENYLQNDVQRDFTIVLADGQIQPRAIVSKVLTGDALNNLLKGGAGDDKLYGMGGNDTLMGAAGLDSLFGGQGDDVYHIQDLDAVTELANEGSDSVLSSISFTLPVNVENLTLSGTENLQGIGNDGNNLLQGNEGNNLLDGKAGADTMQGGLGDDVYLIDNAQDVVQESANSGMDALQASVNFSLPEHVENLSLLSGALQGTGNAANNLLQGNDGNNLLDGKAGADTMQGGLGDDVYVIDNAQDVVQESANSGMDAVQASLNFSLPEHVENLSLLSGALQGTGNAANNLLQGNDGNNLLDGKAGADTMQGGLGDDVYVIDSTQDVAQENSGAGTDTLLTHAHYTMPQHIENLQMQGSLPLIAYGNTLANNIQGNSANNLLDGGAGADTLQGGGGNDTYLIENRGDQVLENPGQGIDLVYSRLSWNMSNEVEFLILRDATNLTANGNASHNLIQGNSGANQINGALGNDILQGAAGDDTLQDSSGSSCLDGGAGADSLSGGAGADLFFGGAGNDVINSGGGTDVFVFRRGGGQDVLQSSGLDDTLVLGNNIGYSNLALRKSGNDLQLLTGNNEQLSFKDWYLSGGSDLRSINTLQVVVDGSADYQAGGSAINNNKVEQFNFLSLVSAFDAARAANPAISEWALAGSLAAASNGGSDSAIIGGDLSWQAARNGNLSALNYSSAQAVLAESGFGSAAQTIHLTGTAQGNLPLLL